MKEPVQTRLFETKRPAPKPAVTFASLSVHQKINYKANECGFQGVPYRSKYNYYAMPLFQPEIGSLSDRYRWHYKVNAGYENRIEVYRKKKGGKLWV